MTIESELRVAALVLRNLPAQAWGDDSKHIDSKEADRCAKAIEDALELIEQSQWQPIETAPKDGTLVAVYSPNGPDDWPNSFKISFDFFCQDYEDWHNHSEAHEHFMAVGGANAAGPDCVCAGPSEKAPYTHWMPLPKPPEPTQ